MKTLPASRADHKISFLSIWQFVGAPAITLALISLYCAGMGISDYLRTPTRHLYEVVVMVPLISLVSFVVASTAQILAYLAIIVYGALLLRRRGHVPLWALLVLSPLLALLTWYGYDHFVPDYRFYTDPDPPYEHGFTLERFAKAWGFEILVVVGYWWPMRRRGPMVGQT